MATELYPQARRRRGLLASLGRLLTVRRLRPKSLLWRTVLIVVLPVVLLQAVVAYLIIERHYDGVTRQMTTVVAIELNALAEAADRAETPDAARAALTSASRVLGFPIRLEETATLPVGADPLFFDVIGRAVEETFQAELDRPIFVAIDRRSKLVDVRAQTEHGVLRAVMSRRRVLPSNPHLLLTWMAAAAMLLVSVALLYLRNQIKPIQQLARAADAFGKGRHEPIRVAGAEEVRMAARAFIDARDRVERHIDQRTRMLSGVSHDLRTPLTRLRLALEMAEDSDERSAMRRDVDEMSHIIEEFLAYARGDQGETEEITDVSALAREIVEEARRSGEDVALRERIDVSGSPRLEIRRRAIKRCLHNLLDNAFAHATTVQFGLTVTRRYAEFVVDDDGPGIAEDERAAALRPFNRLDASRNRNASGGVGLGLALALDTARSHGGDLLLERSPLGGLRAIVRLPR